MFIFGRWKGLIVTIALQSVSVNAAALQ